MRRYLLALGLVTLIASAALTGTAAAQEGPTATAEPSTGLSDGDTVTVTISGFPADATSFQSGQCVTPITDFLQQCDVTNIVPVPLDGDGAATIEITLKTGAIGDGMCGEGEVQCVIAVGSLTETENAGAPIFFGADSPGLAVTGPTHMLSLLIIGLGLVAAGFTLAGGRRLRSSRQRI